eukprot:249525-Amphidinium_carterae.1
MEGLSPGESSKRKLLPRPPSGPLTAELLRRGRSGSRRPVSPPGPRRGHEEMNAIRTLLSGGL